jgi:hypothetical protein
MGANMNKTERDQFAIDLYNETFKAIQRQGQIGIKAIIIHLRVRVLNSNYFDDYALSCKLDLALNNLVRAKKIEFATGSEDGNIVIGFSELK